MAILLDLVKRKGKMKKRFTLVKAARAGCGQLESKSQAVNKFLWNHQELPMQELFFFSPVAESHPTPVSVKLPQFCLGL